MLCKVLPLMYTVYSYLYFLSANIKALSLEAKHI